MTRKTPKSAPSTSLRAASAKISAPATPDPAPTPRASTPAPGPTPRAAAPEAPKTAPKAGPSKSSASRPSPSAPARHAAIPRTSSAPEQGAKVAELRAGTRVYSGSALPSAASKTARSHTTVVSSINQGILRGRRGPGKAEGPVNTAGHPEFALEAGQLKATQDALDAHVQDLLTRQGAGADAETALHLEDAWREQAKELEEHIWAPYYGCMIVRVAGRERRVYIGRQSWSDLKGREVIGWTTPAGQLFASGASEGKLGSKQGEVMLKRSLEIPDGYHDLHEVHDTYVRPGSRADRRLLDAQAPEAGAEDHSGPAPEVAGEASPEQQARARHDMLERALAAQGGANARRDIVATLQPEQDLMIRQLTRGLIVQGPAGSGKTAVLTHRAAWLCSPDRLGHEPSKALQATLMEADDVTLVVPNTGLATSVKLSCQALGMSIRQEDSGKAGDKTVRGLRVYTDGELVQRLAGTRALIIDRTGWLLHAARVTRPQKRHAWARAKVLGDWRLHECIRRMLIRRASAQIAASKDIEEVAGGQTLRLKAADLGARVLELGGLSAPVRGSRGAPAAPSPAPEAPKSPRQVWRALMLEVERQLRAGGMSDDQAMHAARKHVERLWRWHTPMMEIKRVEQDASALADEVEVIIGPKHAALLRGPDPRLSAPTPRVGWIDHLDLGMLLSFQELTDESAERGRSGLAEMGERRHLLVDEAQDLSALVIYGLARRWRGLTLVGDLSQGISGHRGISSWKQAAEAFAAAKGTSTDEALKDLTRGEVPEARSIVYGELTRCYRSTRQITEAAWPVAAPWAKTSPAQAFEREGPPVALKVVSGKASRETSADLSQESGAARGAAASTAKAQPKALWDELAQMCREMQQGEGRVVVVTRGENMAEAAAAELLERDIDAQAITNSIHAAAQNQQAALGSGTVKMAERAVGEPDKASALRRGVTVMDVVTAKGLEAGACIVLGADRLSYDPDIEHDARLLYVAMTRGMHQLGLIARGEAHPSLAHLL